MKEGKWLEPRYGSKETFEKDYPNLDFSAVSVRCPGCREYVTLNRKSNIGKLAGWCKKCNRAVTI